MAKTKDPVCGMQVDSTDAAGTTQHLGWNYYFCSTECKEKFDRQPDQYVGRERGEKRKSAA